MKCVFWAVFGAILGASWMMQWGLRVTHTANITGCQIIRHHGPNSPVKVVLYDGDQIKIDIEAVNVDSDRVQHTARIQEVNAFQNA